MGPKLRQVAASVSVGLLLSGIMTTWGFPAAAQRQMDRYDSIIHFTTEQASWFATMLLLLCIPGSAVSSYIYEFLGPRRAMLIIIPFLSLSVMLMSAASLQIIQDTKLAETFLLGCRIIQGSLAGVLLPFVSVYTFEICDQQLRGTFASLVEVWATLGLLLCYIAGYFLSWITIAWLLPLITFVPSFIGIFLSPESPLWMARKGREEEAETILKLVRCTDIEILDDLRTVNNNLENKDQTCLETIYTAAKVHNVKAMAASILLLIMKELAGYAALSIYVVYMFEQAGVGMGPQLSSMIIGVIRILCNGASSVMMHNKPRKRILFIGNALTGIGTFVTGIFFYLQSTGEDAAWISWLPLIGLTIHIIGAAGFIGPCTWGVAVEILPGPVRSLGFGLTNTSYAITAFAVSKSLIYLQDSIGLYGVFWIFTGGSLGYILLVILYIPETYGKSMKDVEDYWYNQKKQRKALDDKTKV